VTYAPKRLMDHAVEIGQPIQIGRGRRPIAKHALHFVGGVVPGARQGQQRVDGPGQRAAGGLVPGGNEGNDRIANLLVAQGVTLFAATIDQHRHHVIVGSGRGAGAGDLGVDEVVEARAGGHRPSPSRGVDPLLQRHRLRQLMGQVQQGLELLAKEVGVHRDPLAEQAFCGAAPDRGAPLLVDVQPLPGLPAVDDGVDIGHHGLHIVLDLSVTQPRRHYTPPAPVVVPVADDQRCGPVD
jgi:hypothetical protein